VGFIDEYCQAYRHLFGDVRSFEQFKFLHVGLLSELARKTLPAIAQLAGLQNAHSLHHFLRGGVWSVEQLRAVRPSRLHTPLENAASGCASMRRVMSKRGKQLTTLPSNTLATLDKCPMALF